MLVQVQLEQLLLLTGELILLRISQLYQLQRVYVKQVLQQVLWFLLQILPIVVLQQVVVQQEMFLGRYHILLV